MTIDVFFEYAGLVKGFSISAASVSHFLNPIIMGFIVSDHVSFFFFNFKLLQNFWFCIVLLMILLLNIFIQSRSSWNSYFLFLNVFSVWSLIIFFVFGSGKMQDWAKSKMDDVTEKNEMPLMNSTDYKWSHKSFKFNFIWLLKFFYSSSEEDLTK